MPASAGVGVSRAIAKVASGQAKPAGVRMVVGGHRVGVPRPRWPWGGFPGIGPVAQELGWTSAGIETLGQLLDLSVRARTGRASVAWHATWSVA